MLAEAPQRAVPLGLPVSAHRTIVEVTTSLVRGSLTLNGNPAAFNLPALGVLGNLGTNFALPSGGIFTGSGAVSGSAGLITTTTTTSRQIQFSLRLRF